MKRVLVSSLGITALVICALSCYLLYLSGHPSNGLNLHGPLQLSIAGTVRQGHQATQPQLEARALLLSLSPAIHDRGVQNDKMVRVENSGKQVVMFSGYNPSSPWYRIEVRDQGKWSLLPMVYTPGSIPAAPRLTQGQSLEFPVIVPEGAKSWRVGLVYDELPATNLVTRLADRVLTLLRRSREAESERFIVWSDEVQQ
jgi:hypothetical protein